MTNKPASPDWIQIEVEYRAGTKTLRAIADEQGVSHVAIHNRATRGEWTRDLAAKVKAKADEKVNKAAVTKSINTGKTAVTEKEVVDANVDLQYRVRMEARADVIRLEVLVRRLISELEAETDDPDLFAKLGDLLDESGPDENGRWKRDKRNELYTKVISAAWRIDAAKKLVEMTERLVKLKFEVFGVTAGEESNPIDDILKKLSKERQECATRAG